VTVTVLIAFVAVYVVAFLGSALGCLVLNVLLGQRLRTRHRLVWQRLGSPTSSDIALRRDSSTVWSWVWNRCYIELDDPGTVRIASTLRILSVVFMAATLTSVVVAIVVKFLPLLASN
jgi:hypothetical protein